MNNTATKQQNSADSDKRWSDKFIPEIKMILGHYLISAAPLEEDMHHNTDLSVLKLDAVRIGCRIRRPYDKNGVHVFPLYKDEFTIRVERPSGHKTELAKIVEGWGNFFFYGWASDDDKGLQLWRLCDLNVFRRHFSHCLIRSKGKVPGDERKNNDKGDLSSAFRVFQFSTFPAEFVIARGMGAADLLQEMSTHMEEVSCA